MRNKMSILQKLVHYGSYSIIFIITLCTTDVYPANHNIETTGLTSQVTELQNTNTTMPTNLKEKQSETKSKCSKQFFLKTFEDLEDVDNFPLEKYTNDCSSQSWLKKCLAKPYPNELIVTEYFNDEINLGQMYVQVNFNTNPECMVYRLQYHVTSKGSIISEDYLLREERIILRRINVDFSTPYNISLRAILSNKLYVVEHKAPDRCYANHKHIYLKWKDENCTNIKPKKIYEAIKKYCARYTTEQKTSLLNYTIDELSNIIKDANLTCENLEKLKEVEKLKKLEKLEKPEKLEKLNSSLSATSIFLVVLGCVFVIASVAFACYKLGAYQRCLEKLLITVRLYLNAKWLQGDQMENESEPTVMIVNCPGCELVDKLVADLSCILKSYGVVVKLPFLNDSEVDIEGGISSYLQRNIEQCDYVLLMFSKSLPEIHNPSHRPFEFTVNVITGLLSHGKSSSKYIALFTDNYKDAIKYIPTAFHATREFGFKIPKDVLKLVTRISGKDTSNGQQKEREMKNKHFIGQMKETKVKLADDNHVDCQKARCQMGKEYASVSNLSEYWKTTVRSKILSSVNSICETIQEYDCGEMEDAKLLVDYKMQLWKLPPNNKAFDVDANTKSVGEDVASEAFEKSTDNQSTGEGEYTKTV